ncbi:MAG: toxin-antitoxin system YwqK family antitoxin [Cyclobacteriaceae bacterium]|nr:toxin-antitoxin system YwqK family antitoxin [Cyclobacteriaceae bacterium]
MKRHGYLIMIVLAACTASPEETNSEGAANTIADSSANRMILPAATKRESFADTKELERVTLPDGSEGHLVNGVKTGTWITYFSTGAVQSITPYYNGKREGPSVEFNDGGQVIKRIWYHQDMRHGAYREYNYANLKEERNYVFGKIEGRVRVFYDNGKIVEEGNYKNGLRDGVSKWYDQEGNVTIQYEYRDGQLVKK